MRGMLLGAVLCWLAVTPPALAEDHGVAMPFDAGAEVSHATAAPEASTVSPEPTAGAVAPGSPGGVSAWVVSQGKTVTYRVAASIDALIVGYLYTGSLLGGGGIALFNAVVSSVLYDLHETAWNDFGPDPKTDPAGIAAVKTVSYRVVSIANVLATGLYFTGNLWQSSGLALGNAVIDSTIYFFHELAWSRWGPPIRKDGTAEAAATPAT